MNAQQADYLIRFCIALSLGAWAWFGWHYAWPVTIFLFKLLEQRQGFLPACASMGFILMVALWVYFAAAANLKRVIDNKTAPLLMEMLGYTLVLPPMLFLDWLCNMTVFAAIFWDWPARWSELVTGRLKRYAGEIQHMNSKRWRAARVFALILDALDPSGRHI